MALSAQLEGVALDIAYRGSVEAQSLDVGVKLARPAEVPLAPWAVGSLVECVNRGLAGGAEFPPTSGRAKLEAGPTGEGPEAPGELGPDYTFRLSVAGMSPRFVRVIVEHLAASDRRERVRSITVVGGLPPDGTALSVRDGVLARWLDDAATYPAAYPDPGFRVVTKSIPRGAAVRVSLASARMEEIAAELEATLSIWQSAILTYPNARRDGRGLMDPHLSFARTRSELYAKASLFDHAREPVREALINGLARFHATVTPLSSVEIAMP